MHRDSPSPYQICDDDVDHCLPDTARNSLDSRAKWLQLQPPV